MNGSAPRVCRSATCMALVPFGHGLSARRVRSRSASSAHRAGRPARCGRSWQPNTRPSPARDPEKSDYWRPNFAHATRQQPCTSTWQECAPDDHLFSTDARYPSPFVSANYSLGLLTSRTVGSPTL
uniref:Uncharacterized protein n=1 Tax=Burkholderia sp. M701 TaxID=326454 RepID=V5YP19_9BURK|nr:hypothetical protein [Burkholderia sp. M701]